MMNNVFCMFLSIFTYDIFILVIFMDRDGKKTYGAIKRTKGNGDKMPTVENVNYEMTQYLQDIEEYIRRYKNLPQKEAKEQAKKNLMDVGIIDELGNLSGFYRN